MEINAINYWWQKHERIKELLDKFMKENKIKTVNEAIQVLLEKK